MAAKRGSNGQFKKGGSGNPGGRPKGTPSFSAYVRQWFVSKPEDYDAIMAKIIERCKAGDFKFIDMLFDRMEGKVPTRSENVVIDLEIVSKASRIAEEMGIDSDEFKGKLLDVLDETLKNTVTRVKEPDDNELERPDSDGEKPSEDKEGKKASS